MESSFLIHSAKGTSWTKKNHKYIAKKNGRYIYNKTEQDARIEAEQKRMAAGLDLSKFDMNLFEKIMYELVPPYADVKDANGRKWLLVHGYSLADGKKYVAAVLKDQKVAGINAWGNVAHMNAKVKRYAKMRGKKNRKERYDTIHKLDRDGKRRN